MPKLPDELSGFGSRNQPRVTAVAVPGRVGFPIQRAANLQSKFAQTNQPFEDAANTAQVFAQVQGKIQNRDDAVRRARDYSAFNETIGEELRRIQTEEDIADDGTGKKFNDFLNQQLQTVIGQHGGSPESGAQLEIRLTEKKSDYTSQFANLSLTAKRNAVNAIMGQEIGKLGDLVYRDPGNIATAYDELEGMIADWAGVWTANEEEAFRVSGRSAIHEAALDSLLDQGDVQTAEALLYDMPGFSVPMTNEGRRRIQRRIREARGGDSLGAKVREFEQAVGRDATEAEIAKMAGAATSPLVSITQEGDSAIAKEMGKLDAQRVNQLNTESMQAIRDLDEVERMSAAIESERFTTGVFSDARMFLARLADFAGIDTSTDEWKDLIGDAATADTLDSASNKLAVNVAQKLGRITNMSLQFVRDSLPNLTRTPEGNRILLEVMKRGSERTIEISSLADQFIQRYGTLRPKEAKTFFESVRDLEESDPVITPKLRERIIKGSKKGPDTWKEVFTDKFKQEPPAGLEIPEGWTFDRMEGDAAIFTDGKREIRRSAE